VLPRTRDDNGNTTADEQRRYEYDALDRLVRVRDRATGSTQVEYSYDALDRLVRRRAYAPDIVTLFVYDGEQLVEEYDGAALLEREYVWGLSEGDLVQERTPTATWYAHGDGRNDVVALAGASGAIVERYDYDAFGRATVVLDGGTGNCVRFEGEWADPRSNVLVSAGSAYDAGTGRALQEPGGARAVLACVGPGPFPTWGPMPRVRMPTLRDVDPQRWAQQEIQKLYDEMRRAAEGGGCVMPDWKRLEWLEGLANGTSLCPPTTPAPSTELLPLEPFGGPPGGKNIRPSLPGAMQSIHVESVVELPGQYWGFDFGADGAHVPWSWVMPQDPPPTCPPPPTYAYDALDRLVVTHVMVQDPPPAPPAVKEPKWPQDQETRERMVRDFIKKVRDNLPGDSTGGRVIQALREMLKDGEVTDTEMNIAQEMMNGLF
jgi:YD repeat-containing protein